MDAGQNVYTYVSFSSQNISNFMGSKTLTIEFLNNKVLQRSPFRY